VLQSPPFPLLHCETPCISPNGVKQVHGAPRDPRGRVHTTPAAVTHIVAIGSGEEYMVGCLRLPMKEKANKTAMIHRTARHPGLSNRFSTMTFVGPTSSTCLRFPCPRAAMSAEMIEATAEIIATRMLVSIGSPLPCPWDANSRRTDTYAALQVVTIHGFIQVPETLLTPIFILERRAFGVSYNADCAMYRTTSRTVCSSLKRW